MTNRISIPDLDTIGDRTGGHDSTDTIARVILTHLAEPGDTTLGTLLSARTPEEALDLLRNPASGTVPPGVDIDQLRSRAASGTVTAQTIIRELTLAREHGYQILTPTDDRWPHQLDDLGPAAPTCLWVHGNASLLTTAQVAIVGSRAATTYGELVCIDLATGLADRGHIITSGAAYGIDGVAHRAALALGRPTIAVVASGVDRHYPAGHDALLTRIAETGAVVTELPPGTAPTRWRFLARNRIIAALSVKTIVVEAATRSGALTTAGHAHTLGRPVGAVPGPVTSAVSAGCHRLIRDGLATLISTIDDADEL